VHRHAFTMDALLSIYFRLLVMERLIRGTVLWFALIYSERCTRTYTIKTWSTFWRIIYLLMSSECIQIWLGTHFTKQEKNAPSRCRSLFPNSSVKTQQLDSSRNVGYNAFMLIAHTAVRSTNTFFSMSLFALLMPQSTFG
jgi:hypothetical protein